MIRLRRRFTDGEWQAIIIARDYGWVDGSQHKQWVIDQMIRAIAGDKYPNFIGEDWDVGIAP